MMVKMRSVGGGTSAKSQATKDFAQSFVHLGRFIPPPPCFTIKDHCIPFPIVIMILKSLRKRSNNNK